MPTVNLVKTASGDLRGFGQAHDQEWKRLKGWMKKLEPGEFFTLTIKQQRNLKFHRKYFALLNFLFDHWEPEQGRKRLAYKGIPIEKSFESFREQTIILAGFYEQTFDLQGRMRLTAKSISFDKMSEDDFEQLYKATINVGMKHILPRSYTEDGLARVLEELERFD